MHMTVLQALITASGDVVQSQGHLTSDPVHTQVDTQCWVSCNPLQPLLSTSITSLLTTTGTWVSGLKADSWMQDKCRKML